MATVTKQQRSVLNSWERTISYSEPETDSNFAVAVIDNLTDKLDYNVVPNQSKNMTGWDLLVVLSMCSAEDLDNPLYVSGLLDVNLEPHLMLIGNKEYLALSL